MLTSLPIWDCSSLFPRGRPILLYSHAWVAQKIVLVKLDAQCLSCQHHHFCYRSEEMPLYCYTTKSTAEHLSSLFCDSESTTQNLCPSRAIQLLLYCMMPSDLASWHCVVVYSILSYKYCTSYATCITGFLYLMKQWGKSQSTNQQGAFGGVYVPSPHVTVMYTWSCEMCFWQSPLKTEHTPLTNSMNIYTYVYTPTLANDWTGVGMAVPKTTETRCRDGSV